jgi:hypothetical protein
MRSRALLADLGLPSTQLSLQIVSLLKQVQAKLEPAKIGSFLRLASKFSGKEASAAEAAVALAAAGIDADEGLVGDLLVLMGEDAGSSGGSGSRGGSLGAGDGRDFGDSGSAPSGERLLSRLNRKGDSARQWFIFPFSRDIAGAFCAGSLRFLVDRKSASVVETRITFNDGKRVQRFVLDGSPPSCRFDSVPAFPPVSSGRFVVYLLDVLSSCGIADVRYGTGSDSPTATARVDLEA